MMALAMNQLQMAVAAYAAVVSLMHVLDQIQQYPQRRLRLDKNQIETLREKVSFLQDFLELYSQRCSQDIESLAGKIAEVAIEAEDIIDNHVVDHQLRIGSADKSDLSFPCEGIGTVIEKIDSIEKALMMIKEGMTIQERGPRVLYSASSSAPPLRANNTMVRFDERLNQIIDELIGDKCDLQVLPIVGMGGIGKTTLAQNVFGNSYIMRHFDSRTWLTVSQEYSMQGILLGLLGEPGDLENKRSGEDLAKLGGRLYKSLFDRRYLIVLDDVWSTDVWNDIKSFFLDNKSGSRIVVTTRESNAAVSFSSSSPYLMDFLDEDKSWDLFCKKAFAKDDCCPLELEEIGRNIAKSCKGLPLEIVVIGGLLSKSNMTREHWESVVENVNSFANSGDDEHCLKILSLSYNHLPIHLKPCFLYMRLWVAEGFLKPIKDKTLEEVAREYLEDFIGRNLILIFRLGNNGEVKTCIMHDLLRDLCIRESQKEKFYCVPKQQKVGIIRIACFLCFRRGASTRIDLTRLVVASQPTSIASCLVCDNCRITYPQLNKLRLVKVIDGYYRRSSDEDILHPTKLRVLSISAHFNFIDNAIHLLWNLQSLIIYNQSKFSDIHLPSEIWELPQLRHIIVSKYTFLPDPPLIVQVKDSTIILENLQTLYTVKDFKWSEDAVERVPNLRELGICYFHLSFTEWSNYSLHNLCHLHKLESLRLDAEPLLTLKIITFPQSLKKLSLQHCSIPWEEMTIIGSLPNLEELNLYYDTFRGREWNSIEGEFLQLKLLLIHCSDLKFWGAEKSHFPNLECLELRGLKYLEEIPLGIGEKETLHSIKIHNCSESAVYSAKKILEEQYNFGNEDFQLYVDSKLVLPGCS